jgi:hypothetical protein
LLDDVVSVDVEDEENKKDGKVAQGMFSGIADLISGKGFTTWK